MATHKCKSKVVDFSRLTNIPEILDICNSWESRPKQYLPGCCAVKNVLCRCRCGNGLWWIWSFKTIKQVAYKPIVIQDKNLILPKQIKDIMLQISQRLKLFTCHFLTLTVFCIVIICLTLNKSLLPNTQSHLQKLLATSKVLLQKR